MTTRSISVDLTDRVHDLRGQIQSRLPGLEENNTKEAAKLAFVMPFIRSILGYNPNEPSEVVPEFTADVGDKKGEKVDYAIMKDGKPIIFIECKKHGTLLNSDHASQLERYMGVREARFGILTNGIIYQFFTDLDKPNRMDKKPFFEFNVLEPEEELIGELKKFTKPSFDIDKILAIANDLKYTGEIKRLLSEEWNNPSVDFVRYFASRLYPGTKTKAKLQQFQSITKSAPHQFIRDRISDRLNSALAAEKSSSETGVAIDTSVGTVENAQTSTHGATSVTTEDELSGYYIVKAVLRESIDARRIAKRDQKSYCAVLLDDKNYKPICRLWFNSKQKYLGLLDEQKKEERIPIDDIDDIFKYADRLKAAVSFYDS